MVRAGSIHILGEGRRKTQEFMPDPTRLHRSKEDMEVYARGKPSITCIEIVSSPTMAHLNRQSCSVRHRQVFLKPDSMMVEKLRCYMSLGADGNPCIKNARGVLRQRLGELG